MINFDVLPKIRLVEMDLIPILPAVSIGRMPPSLIPDLINKAVADSDPANMYMRMFYLFLALGKSELALEMQAKAIGERCIYRIATRASHPTIRLLAIMGLGDMVDNTPLEYVLENSDIRLDLLFLLPDQELPEAIPDHDVAIIAICESAKNRPLLARLEMLVATWPRPVLNHPHHIPRCARDRTYRLLNGIPGLIICETQKLARDQILKSCPPFTIRPVDTHSGKGFAKIDVVTELESYLEMQLEAEFFISKYVDYQSEDGFFRKVRIALIDGNPYVSHLAISNNWVVHYDSSGMLLSEKKRIEEAEMMENFDQDFAVRHRDAFNMIAVRLGLDYVILDCAEMRDGRLLLFEADTGGWIHSTDPVDIFPYKPKIMQKAFDAFRTMLLNRATNAKIN